MNNGNDDKYETLPQWMIVNEFIKKNPHTFGHLERAAEAMAAESGHTMTWEERLYLAYVTGAHKPTQRAGGAAS